MAMMELFQVAAKLVLDKSGYDQDVQEADKSGKSLAENLSGYMEKAKNVITGIMGAIAIKKVASDIWDLAKETAAAGDRIDKTSQALGLSRQAFQEWDYILAQNGASIDSLGASMRTLQSAISANSGETAAALSQLGLSAARLQSMSPEEQFDSVVKALQKLPDGAKKSQLAMQLLGKNAQSLMPLLNSSAEATEELRQRAHDLGLVMSDEDIDASVAFGDALDDLTKTWNGLKQKFGAQILPFLTKGLNTAADALGKISNAVRNAFKTGDWSGVFKTVVDQLKSILHLDQITWPTWDDVKAAAIVAWDAIKKGLTTVFKFIFGETEDGGIKWPTWNDVKKAAETAWGLIKEGLKSVFKFVFGESENGGIDWPTWDEIRTGFTQWWDGEGGISDKIQEATKWVLGLFGLPEVDTTALSKDVDAWFTGFVRTIVDACGWVLGLFGLPTNVNKEQLADDVTTWFSGFSSVLIDACNWVLGLFGLPKVNAEALKDDVWNWFGGFSSTIVDACSWVLGLFGLPTNVDKETLKDDVSLWFSGFSGILVEACNWLLGLFGLPTVNTETLKNDVGMWFDGFVSTIVDACSWVLGLFGLPTDVNTETLRADVSKWFDGFSSIIVSACDWVLSLFGLPKVDTETLKKSVSDWFGGFYSTLVDACAWVLGLFGLPTNVNLETLSADVSRWFGGIRDTLVAACDWVLGVFGLPKISDVVQKVSDWWNGSGEENSGVKGLVTSALDYVLVSFGLPKASKVIEDIKAWWNRILSHIRLSLKAVWDGVTGGQMGIGQTAPAGADPTEEKVLSTPWWVSMPSFMGHFAKGLNYVPYDGYAFVHRGETILNQDKGRAYREGNGFNSQELYNVVAAAVASAVSGIQINMDGKQVGNAVTDQVSKNIYRAQYGRRFTYA